MRRWTHLPGLFLAISFLVGCGDEFGSRGQSNTEEGGFFYRMQAEFIHKETGEPISFDYVVACNRHEFSNVATTSTVFHGREPHMMFQPVGTKHALRITTINMCEDWKWGDDGNGEPRIPDALRPLAVWHEDINDLSFGWGYKSDDAYESPLAKIEFVQASVTPTDAAAWRAWRENAEQDYEQIGALPGPWGYNEEGDPYMARMMELGLESAYYGIASIHCPAMSKVPMDQDLVDRLFAFAPEDVGRYWYFGDIQSRYPDLAEEFFRDRDAFGDGERYSSYSYQKYPNLGTVGRTDRANILPTSGNDSKGGYLYREYFPLLVRSLAMPDVTSPQDSYFQRVLLDDDYKGFGACVSRVKPIDLLNTTWRSARLLGDAAPPVFDARGRGKPHRLYIGDELVRGDAEELAFDIDGLFIILDRTGFVLFFYR